jgi:hypothetical protein
METEKEPPKLMDDLMVILSPMGVLTNYRWDFPKEPPKDGELLTNRPT